MNLSVFELTSKLLASSIIEIPTVLNEVVTPLFSPNGVKIDES